MLSVSEATQIILDHAQAYGTENMPLENCVGRVLAQDITADRDFPPFDRVAMDGIAIAHAAYADGQRKFTVEGVQPAGSPPHNLKNTRACLEVMTGAVLPGGADTVIRYEDMTVDSGVAVISEGASVKAQQNVHHQATDRSKGDLLLPAGRVLSAAEVGVAATVGQAKLAVKCLPSVAVISTGDELVPITDVPKPHQIRSSNQPTITAALKGWGVSPAPHHIMDDLEQTKEQLGSLLAQHDVLILSGGVSKGKFDYVPEALAALGVRKLFHRVRQRPGKPFWFGCTDGGKVVFALPGNPISSVMCVLRYFQPWLRTSLGLGAGSPLYARLMADYAFAPPLTRFLQVRLDYSSQTGALQAHPMPSKGSGDLANLADADGFLELPAERESFGVGEVFPVWGYRSGWI